MTLVYSPLNSLSPKFDPARCAETIWDRGRGIISYQCRRKPVVQEEGHGWCRTHAPSAERARLAATDARVKAEVAASARKWAIRDAEKRVVDAAKAWSLDGAGEWPSGEVLAAAVAELDRLEAEQHAGMTPASPSNPLT